MSIATVLNKNKYTDRVFQRDKQTLLLKLNCIVDKDSYLFSASIPSTLPEFSNIRRKLESMCKEALIKGLDLKKIEGLINEIDEQRIRNTRDFPRFDNKYYFIPGSSLKGAIRSRIEYKLIKDNKNAYSCYIVDGYYDLASSSHIKFWNIDNTQRQFCNPPNVCIVCDMFGNKSLASLTEFSDAITYDNNPVERINKLNGIEAIKPNTKFVMDIVCKNYDYLRLGLLFLGLELYSKSPILIGMYKYRYNEKVGKQLFDNKYWFGKLRFELINAYDINNKEYDIDKLLQTSKEELMNNEIGRNIDLEKGVIK